MESASYSRKLEHLASSFPTYKKAHETAGTREYVLEYLAPLDAKPLDEIGRLRITAWEASGSRPKMAPKVGDTWTDSHDDHAHHWTIMEQGRIVAAARMCVHNLFAELPDHEDLVACQDKFVYPVAAINRLVIHPDCRRNGLVRPIDLARLGAQ